MSLLSAADIHLVLRNKLKSKNFEFVSCSSVDMAGIPSVIFSSPEKVSIKYRVDGREEEIYLFIKRMPASPCIQRWINYCGTFRKEVILYDKFLNTLIDKFDGNPIPTCYLGREDEIVVLKDLSQEGFSNVPLLDTFSLDHCLKALESVAKIHAASLAFEVKQRTKISDHIKILQEESLLKGDDNSVARKPILQCLEALRCIKIKYLPYYDEVVTEKVVKYLTDLQKIKRTSTKYPNVLSHCDLWANNIMFRYTSQGKVAEACIIDFQLAAYRSLGYDVLMLVYLCTDKQLRDKHLKVLFEHYYSSLSKELKSDEIYLTKLLPYSEFEVMLCELLPVLLGITSLYLQFVLMPDEILKNVLQSEDKWVNYYEKNRSDYVLKVAEENLLYRSRVVEALRELFDYFKCKTV